MVAAAGVGGGGCGAGQVEEAHHQRGRAIFNHCQCVCASALLPCVSLTARSSLPPQRVVGVGRAEGKAQLRSTKPD